MRTHLLIATAIALSIASPAMATPEPETLVFSPLPAEMAGMEHVGRYCATYVIFEGQKLTLLNKLKRGETREDLPAEIKAATFCDSAAKEAYKAEQMAESWLLRQQMQPIMHRSMMRMYAPPLGSWKKK